MTRLTDNAPRLDPERLRGPIPYGHWRAFLALNERYAFAVTDPGGEERMLSVSVADMDGHPFDLAPVALGVERVRELHEALGEWLGRAG